MLAGRFVEQLAVGDRADELLEVLLRQHAVEAVLKRGLQLLQAVGGRQHLKDEELPRIEVVGLAQHLVAQQVALFLALDDAESLEPPQQVGGQHDLLGLVGHFSALASVAAAIGTPLACIAGARSLSCSTIHPPPIDL